MAAPTAVNRQPWAFVVVTDRKTLDTLAAGLPYAKMLDKAGAAIIVCAIPEKAHDKRMEFAVIDNLRKRKYIVGCRSFGIRCGLDCCISV